MSAQVHPSQEESTAPKDVAIDREVYHPDKVKDGDFDTIVIGSGIGGLSVASLLAQQGQKVLVLEQHYVAGGACHAFQSGGYEFGTGVHYLGDLEEIDGKPNFRALANTLTRKDDPIVWDKMDDNFDTVVIGDPANRFEIVAGEEAYEKKLVEKFPNEKKAIKDYLKLTHQVDAAFAQSAVFKLLPLPLARFLTRTGIHRLFDEGYHRLATTTVKQGMAKLTKDEDLQAVLAYNFGDYGTEPNRAPFILQAMITKHYIDGAYYPHNGPSSIPQKIIQKIGDHESKVLVSAPVKRILTENKKVTGVEMEDGTTIQAKTIVSDVGLANTATKLLPTDLIKFDFAAADQTAACDKLHPSITGIKLFVGLKGDPETLHLPKCNTWIYPSNDLSGTVENLRKMSLDEAMDLNPRDLGPLFVAVPGTKEKAWTKRFPNKSTLEIIFFGPWTWFEKFADTWDDATKSHGPEYEAAKQRLAEKMWSRTVEVLEATGSTLPKTLDAVDHFQVGSPLTFNHFFRWQSGAFYGLDNDTSRFQPKNYYLRLRPEVPEVQGLYLTGADVLGSGVATCAMTGLLCASKILGWKNPFSLLE